MRVLWSSRLALLAAALSFAARPARAQQPTEASPAPAATNTTRAPAAPDPGTYALSWVRDDGAESCPAGRELARDVTARLGRSPFDETAARTIEIRVERTATGFRSRVHVRGVDDGVLGRRMLTSDEPSCAPLF